MEADRPIDINSVRIQGLRNRKTLLYGEIAEIDLEIGRLENGQKPRDLTPPRDRFWKQSIDFNQGRLEQQANEQSDAKQMEVPPYKHLLQ